MQRLSRSRITLFSLRGFTRHSAPPRLFETRCADARRSSRRRRPLTQAVVAVVADADVDTVVDAAVDEKKEEDSVEVDDRDADGDDAAAHTRTR